MAEIAATSADPRRATAKDSSGSEPVRHMLSFYVYSAPVRIWHWATMVLVCTLALTGFFIASPFHSVQGDTSKLFVMGHLREWHYTAAWLLIIGMVYRAYLAFAGDKHDRQIYFVPFWSKAWWKDLLSVVRWYFFIDRRTHKWVGHNPLARLAMWSMFTLGTFFMAFSGLAMYGEARGIDSWEYRTFGWMVDLAGTGFSLRTWHHLGMYLLLLFTVIHIYAAVRDDIMGRVSTVSSMINGWRTFRDFED